MIADRRTSARWGPSYSICSAHRCHARVVPDSTRSASASTPVGGAPHSRAMKHDIAPAEFQARLESRDGHGRREVQVGGLGRDADAEAVRPGRDGGAPPRPQADVHRDVPFDDGQLPQQHAAARRRLDPQVRGVAQRERVGERQHARSALHLGHQHA